MRSSFAALLVLLLLAGPVAAKQPAPTAPPVAEAGDLCTVAYQLTHPGQCPMQGPGGRAEFRHRYELPADLPPLAAFHPDVPGPVLTRSYAKVTTANAPIFASPEDGAAGNVKRSYGKGFIYVSIGKTVDYGGQEYIKINADEYMRREDLSLLDPSQFQGIGFTEQPARPFAWVVRPYFPRLRPDGSVNPGAPKLERYTVVQIYGKERMGDFDWYLVGPDQWVEQRSLGIVEMQSPPEGVTGKWITVNLYEQTVAAYEGDTLVYATLASSGLGAWPTRPGLFQIYSKLEATKMSGAYAADKSDFYYLEDVPWTMYFDRSIALHGAYWHDGYGFPKSHGCVNLAPKDSRWLYGWAEIGATVYVYDPSGLTPTDIVPGGGP